jgi:hypothetical protein
MPEFRHLGQPAHRLTNFVQDPSGGCGVVLSDVVAEVGEVVASLG